MKNEIEFFTQKIENKELLINTDNLNAILTEIDDLSKVVYDFSTHEGIEEAKKLKTLGNGYVKDLKAFCEPYEAEGKKIMDARSLISTRLITGKDSVINTILEPIAEIERKLKYLNMQIVTPITDIHSCDMISRELVELEAYEWLAHKKGAEMLINQQKDLIAAARKRFEDEAKALHFARLEREAEIAKNAAEQAKRQTEEKIRREQEEKERGEQAKINVEKRQREAEGLVDDKAHRFKVKNDIFIAIGKLPHNSEDEFIKDIIRAVSRGEIPNLYIKY